MLLYQFLPYAINGKMEKIHANMINLKNLLRNGMMNLNYLMDHILYQIFKIFFNIFKKAWRKHIILQ